MHACQTRAACPVAWPRSHIMWHAGKAAIKSAAQPARAAAAGSSQQDFRWPWQQEEAGDQENAVGQVNFTALLCNLHATSAVQCMFGDCKAE